MWKTLLPGVVFIFYLATFPSSTWAQKKDKKTTKGNPDATPAEYAQIQSMKELVGRLETSNGKSLTLTLEFPHMEANPNFKGANFGNLNNNNYYRDLQDLQRQQIAIAREDNPVQRQRRLIELQRDMVRIQQQMMQQQAKAAKNAADPKNGPFRVVVDKKDFELDVEDKAQVRWNNPPSVYDDKGFLKTYTKEELVELKGKDNTLPGYAGKFDDLVAGQLVKLTLTPVKKEDLKKKADTKKDDEAVGNVVRPTVKMVLIMEDSNLATMNPKGKGKR